MYSPLSTDLKEIRLLTILPGQFNDVIHCTLHVVSLTAKPVYDALSYVWGDPAITREIHVQGDPHQVTSNLEKGLRHLRLADKPRVIWIDALCINQADLAERGSQVAQMGSIYRGAREVIAWLGEEEDSSNLALDFAEAGSSLSYWCRGSSSPVTQAILGSQHVQALGALMNRLWWQRVWTFQELVLAKSLYFVCSQRRMNAEVFFAMGRTYFSHSNTCSKCDSSQKPHREDIVRLNEMLAILVMLDSSRQDAEQLHIPHTIALYRGRECTDPRDKIYGFRGLEAVNKGSSSRPPDYSSSVSDVYAQAAINLIATHKELVVFSQLLPRCAPHKSLISDDIPTWAPDWSAKATQQVSLDMYTRMTNLRLYNASAPSPVHFRSREFRRLSLKGRVVGTIGSLSDPCPSDHRADANIYYGWRHFARIDERYDATYAGRDDITFGDAYWQTLCAAIVPARSGITDLGDVVRTDPKKHRMLHDTWWDSVLPDDDVDGRRHLQARPDIVAGIDIAQFFNCVGIATTMRRFFVDEKEHGWMGLVPQDAEEGDRIAVIDGGRVPYVIRPSDREPGCWTLVGDAYVHGIMDGEIMTLSEPRDMVMV